MEQELKLCTIEDAYVRYLSTYDNRVTSNKENNRKFERKYLGTVLSVNGVNYFVPLASPKHSDFHNDKDGVKRIRKNIIPIIRMTDVEKDGSITLIGTLKFNNMIPVLDSVVMKYDIANEKDVEYQNLVYKQWDYIRTHKSEILKNARTIYNQKTKNIKGIGYLDNTVDFLLLEEKANGYA